MREFIATMVVIVIIGISWFPQTTGNIAHRVFNELRIGWESVR